MSDMIVKIPEQAPNEVRQAAERLLAENPGVADALEAFNVSYEQYQMLMAAQISVRTYAGPHTLLINQRA